MAGRYVPLSLRGLVHVSRSSRPAEHAYCNVAAQTAGKQKRAADEGVRDN